MKKFSFLLMLITAFFIMMSISTFAITSSNTKDTAKVLTLNKKATVTFDAVYDEYYEDYDWYDFNYYFSFTPTKTATYEIEVTSSGDNYFYLIDENKSKLFDDEYPVCSYKMEAGKEYFINFKDYVEDEAVKYSVIVRTHTHDFDIYDLDKADFEYTGWIDEQCISCGYENYGTIAKVKTPTLSSSSFKYTGEKITPKVTVKDSSGKTLKKDTDYTLSGSTSATKVGSYTITVKMKGNYSGSKKLAYVIIPQGTSISSLSAVAEGFSIKVKKQDVQTSGYEIQYSVNSDFSSGKKVKITGSSTLTKKVTGLKGNTKYYVRVRTYKIINDIYYYSSWSDSKTVKTLYKPSIKLNNTTYKLAVGQKATLKATVVPLSQAVTWKSGSTSVVKVDSKGNITGVKAGTATITASMKYKDKTYTSTCKVTVKNPSISLSKSALTVYIGSSATITASTFPSKRTVKWSTNSSSIATVSSGKITGKKAGTCTITASFTYNGKTYKTTCKVTVKKYTPTKSEEQAVKMAKSYLEFIPFSKQGLIEQLEYEGFSHSDAVYGATHCGANWKQQAVKSAGSYLDFMAFSKQGLIEQLEYDGYTHEEAVYGVSKYF